jgi:adenine nucleotide transporter 17
VEENESKPIMRHFIEIYQEGGIKALWKGFLPGLILVLNPIINFVVYEKLREMTISSPGQVPSAGKVFVVSLIAKFIATIFTYPILTIKTKAFTDKKGESTSSLLLKFIKKEGAMALYRGLYAKLFQTLLYNAFMMMTFEKIRALFSSKLS